jgi:hypothetical protein
MALAQAADHYKSARNTEWAMKDEESTSFFWPQSPNAKNANF